MSLIIINVKLLSNFSKGKFLSDNMNEEVKNLENRIKNIENKLDKILEILENNIKTDCNKMSNHIDFIENIYDNIKNPLGFLVNKFNYYISNNDCKYLEK